MNTWKQARWLLAVLLWPVALAGCGEKDPSLSWTLVPVSGQVTLDGQPLADAQVAFHIQDNPPPGFVASGAVTDAQGRFELKSAGRPGAPVGWYKVTVSRYVDADGKPLDYDAEDDSEEGMTPEMMIEMGEATESVPLEYTTPDETPIEVEVTEGTADGYDVELAS